MTYLLLYLLALSLFTHAMHFAQRRDGDLLVILPINYVIAAVTSIALVYTEGGAIPWKNTLVMSLGIINGVIFFVHLLFILESFKIAGTGITMTLVQSGCILPVLFAHLVWPQTETMSAMQWTALAIVPFCVILMRPERIQSPHLALKHDFILLVSFLGVGVTFSIHKVVETNTNADGQIGYQAVLFTAAMVSSVAYAFVRGKRLTRLDSLVGVLAGALNTATLRTLMLALDSLGAVRVYLISGPSLVVINIIVGLIVWKDKITRWQMLGVLIAFVVVTLTCLG